MKWVLYVLLGLLAVQCGLVLGVDAMRDAKMFVRGLVGLVQRWLEAHADHGLDGGERGDVDALHVGLGVVFRLRRRCR